MGGVLSSVIYGLPLKQVNSPFIINSGLRQSINPLWQFAYLLGQPVLPLQQMALGGCDSTVRRRKVLAHFDEIGRKKIDFWRWFQDPVEADERHKVFESKLNLIRLSP